MYKERCQATGYLMTKPFERNNPMPGQFNETCDYIVKLLKPVIKPKGGAKPKGGEGGGAKKEKPAKPAGGGKLAQPAADEDPICKARLAIGKVIEVSHVENSDKLYCCKVQVGPEEVEAGHHRPAQVRPRGRPEKPDGPHHRSTSRWPSSRARPRRP